MSQSIEDKTQLITSGLRVARLVTGENIIGRLEENFLVNVFRINISVDSNFGGTNLNLSPYMFPITPKLDYFIPINQCIIIDIAPENLSNLYVETITRILKESVALQQQYQESLNNQPENSEDIENGSGTDE